MTPEEVKAWDDYVRSRGLTEADLCTPQTEFLRDQERLRKRFEQLEIESFEERLTAADRVMLREMKIGI